MFLGYRQSIFNGFWYARFKRYGEGYILAVCKQEKTGIYIKVYKYVANSLQRGCDLFCNSNDCISFLISESINIKNPKILIV